MLEEYGPQRAKEIDDAIAQVAALCPETLAQRGIALPSSYYNRLRFHAKWGENGVEVIVKLAASDDREETRQRELYRCTVRGTRSRPATMRA